MPFMNMFGHNPNITQNTNSHPAASSREFFRVNDTVKVFLTPTVYKGQKGIRATLVNWRTTIFDIEMVTGLMHQIITETENASWPN